MESDDSVGALYLCCLWLEAKDQATTLSMWPTRFIYMKQNK